MENKLLRLGVIAGALASVIGLILKLTGLIFSPSPVPPPPAALISAVDIGDRVGISEAFGKTPSARICPDISKSEVFRVSAPASPSGARGLEFVSYVAEAPAEQTQTEPTDTTTQTTETDPATPTDPTDTITTPPIKDFFDHRAGAPITKAKIDGIDASAVKVVADPQTVQAPSGLRIIDGIDTTVLSRTGDPGEAQQLEQYTRGLSIAPEGVTEGERQSISQHAALTPTSKVGTAEPVGRLIDLTVMLSGLKSQCVQLRWSLYEAKTNLRVKESWLRDRAGLSFVPDRNDAVTSAPAIWVPLPRRSGRYFVRMGIFAEDGSRLTINHSPSFSEDNAEATGLAPT